MVTELGVVMLVFISQIFKCLISDRSVEICSQFAICLYSGPVLPDFEKDIGDKISCHPRRVDEGHGIVCQRGEEVREDLFKRLLITSMVLPDQGLLPPYPFFIRVR